MINSQARVPDTIRKFEETCLNFSQELTNLQLVGMSMSAGVLKVMRAFFLSSGGAFGARHDSGQVFKLDTVTYGTKPASFISVRAMQQLAEDEKTSFPIGAKILLRDFYVDDLITGGNSTEEFFEIMRHTIGLLDKSHFKLRKWCSKILVLWSIFPIRKRIPFSLQNSWYRLGFNLGYSAILHIANESSSKILQALCPVYNCSLWVYSPDGSLENVDLKWASQSSSSFVRLETDSAMVSVSQH